MIRLESLSDEEIDRGFSVVADNAKSILDDAELLWQNQRYSRAYTLYQLASEEAGKCVLLLGLLMLRKSKSDIYKSVYKVLNDDFLNHTRKSEMARTLELYMVNMFSISKESTNVSADELAAYSKALREEESKLKNTRKNNSLYTTIEDGVFVAPVEMITEDMTNSIRMNSLLRVHIMIIMKNALPIMEQLMAIIGPIKRPDPDE